MNVLIFLPYGGVSPHHYSIGLEIIQDHLNQGHRVTVLRCNASLRSCSFNPEKKLELCLPCKSIFKQGLTLLEGGAVIVKDFMLLNSADQKLIRDFNPSFSSIEELKDVYFEGYDVGMGVASTMISHIRNSRVDTDAFSKEIHALMYASVETYLSIKNHLALEKYDALYLFNGRYSEFRAAFRAAHSAGVAAKIYEYGSDLSKYMVYDDHLPHSISNTTLLIEKAWTNAAGNPERNKLAEDFFHFRKNGVERAYYSFTKDQSADLIPNNFDENKYNVVIYNSSEDEVAAIGQEWANTLHGSQINGIRKIYETLADSVEKDKFHLYLRVHPNLKYAEGNEFEQLNNLDPSLFTCIPAASPVSSYALLDKADLVLSFGSTMGAEATFWKKASIQLSPSWYEQLNVCYQPKSHDELMTMILGRQLSPLSDEGALKYGYYINTYGIEKKISKMKGFIELDHIKGVPLKPDSFTQLKQNLLFIWKNPGKYIKMKFNRSNTTQN